MRCCRMNGEWGKEGERVNGGGWINALHVYKNWSV